jgi:hypothetical protein
MGPFLFGGLWALVLAGFIMLFFPHNGYLPLHKFANLQNRGGGILGYWSLDILSLYHL